MRGEHLRVHLPGIETAAEAALWTRLHVLAHFRSPRLRRYFVRRLDDA
ncbi:hypothetical protein [Brevibacterium paucivorans]